MVMALLWAVEMRRIGLAAADRVAKIASHFSSGITLNVTLRIAPNVDLGLKQRRSSFGSS